MCILTVGVVIAIEVNLFANTTVNFDTNVQNTPPPSSTPEPSVTLPPYTPAPRLDGTVAYGGQEHPLDSTINLDFGTSIPLPDGVRPEYNPGSDPYHRSLTITITNLGTLDFTFTTAITGNGNDESWIMTSTQLHPDQATVTVGSEVALTFWLNVPTGTPDGHHSWVCTIHYAPT